MRRLVSFLSLLALAVPAQAQDAAYPTLGSIERLDDRLDDLIPEDATIEQVAEGFAWSEGPVWVRRPLEASAADTAARMSEGGYLLFSDIPNNTIHKWSETSGLEVFLRPAGYMWSDPAGKELGTNGLALDGDGRLVMCDHGNRAIVRLNAQTFTKTQLATTYGGRRFNSPNDLAVHSSGAIYFTDPSYGLEGLNASPVRELSANGVYRLSPEGDVTLATGDFTFPNGLAFSPDESILYIGQSDGEQPILRAYDVQPDGSLANGRLFFDAKPLRDQGRAGAPDGMAVAADGTVFATGPGGVLVIAPDGTHLGTIQTGQATANCTFGGADGQTLYMTADSLLLRIRTNVTGAGF
ncbi:MAG: SMP-30/gluconolactonase/LRE family protein [Rhodothermales bacterium]